MLLDVASLLLAAVAGIAIQRRAGGGEGVRERLWLVNYWVLIPAAATYAFLAIELDRALVALFACTVGAWWLTVAAAYAWSRAVAPTRARRGALTLVGAFPNTGFIGFPLAHLAFGDEGLRLAIVYDQVSLLVPAIVVATIIARQHAVSTPADTGSRAPTASPDATPSLMRQVALSPPLWTVIALISLRLTVVHDPITVDWLGSVIGATIGPVGFLLLGLSIPLSGFSHDRREVRDVTGAVLVRIGVAPGLVWVVARVAGVDVPTAMYLIAAMPTAFHALVIARLNHLEVATVRLGVLTSTIVVVAATVIGVGLMNGA